MEAKAGRVRFIFATMFLDSLGVGLLIPILPDIIRRFSPDPVFVAQYFGYFISVYALMQFVASPILGSLSDRYGRRPILLVSLLGAGLDYILMAFAPTLGWLFVGRIISGLTGASMTVASAFMADVSDEKTRSANFGMIGAAFGLGFIVGPALGGLLGTLGPTVPFLAAAVLNLLNFAFGYFVLPESLDLSFRRDIHWTRLNPFRSMAKILHPSPILVLIWIYLLLILAGQAHPSTWTLYTQTKFGWSATQVGLSLSFVGFAIAIVQGGLTRVIIPKLGEIRSLVVGIILSMLGYLAFALVPQGWMLYVILAPFAVGGISGPASQSLITARTPPSEQGELQGTLVSLASLTAIIGPLMYTSLFAFFTKPNQDFFFPGVSYACASLVCLLALLLTLLPHFSKTESSLSPEAREIENIL